MSRGRKRHRKKARKLYHDRRLAEIHAQAERESHGSPVVRHFIVDTLIRDEQSKVFTRAMERRFGKNWRERVPRGLSIETPITFGVQP